MPAPVPSLRPAAERTPLNLGLRHQTPEEVSLEKIVQAVERLTVAVQELMATHPYTHPTFIVGKDAMDEYSQLVHRVSPTSRGR